MRPGAVVENAKKVRSDFYSLDQRALPRLALLRLALPCLALLTRRTRTHAIVAQQDPSQEGGAELLLRDSGGDTVP